MNIYNDVKTTDIPMAHFFIKGKICDKTKYCP